MPRLPFLRRPLFGRLAIIQSLFGGDRRYAAEASARWRGAAERDPELMADLIRLGQVLAPQAQILESGVPSLAPIDPMRIQYELGRRDLAVQLITMMGIGPYELSRMMETNDVPE